MVSIGHMIILAIQLDGYFGCKVLAVYNVHTTVHVMSFNHLPSYLLCRQVDFALSVYDSSSSNQIQAPSAICSREGNGLSVGQKTECTLQPDAALAIAEGALYGLQECSRQLSDRRWNCSYDNRQHFMNGLQQSKLRNKYSSSTSIS